MTEEKRLELLKRLDRCGQGWDDYSDAGDEALSMVGDLQSVLRELLEAMKEEL